MAFEDFSIATGDWTHIVESNISAVPNPGGTGGASPGFIGHHDVASVLEPDGVTMGVNNKVYNTSSGWDLGNLADGTLGYDRLVRVFPQPTFGNGLGDFNIAFEWAYWDGMARGTRYQMISLSNDTAPSYYNGAGKGSTPVPTSGGSWDFGPDDSGGLWLGDSGIGGANLGVSYDALAGGLPARVDGTLYYGALTWNDTTKVLAYTEYTDATRLTVAGTASTAPGAISQNAWTTVLLGTNENQIKTAFSGRDQQSIIQNLNLNLITGPVSDISATLPAFTASVSETYISPTTKVVGAALKTSTGSSVAAGLKVLVCQVNGDNTLTEVAQKTTDGAGIVAYSAAKVVHPDYVFILPRQPSGPGSGLETVVSGPETPV